MKFADLINMGVEISQTNDILSGDMAFMFQLNNCFLVINIPHNLIVEQSNGFASRLVFENKICNDVEKWVNELPPTGDKKEIRYES